MSMTSSSLTGSIQLDQFEDHFGNAAEIHLCLIRSEQQPSIYNSDALRSRGTQSQSQKERAFNIWSNSGNPLRALDAVDVALPRLDPT